MFRLWKAAVPACLVGVCSAAVGEIGTMDVVPAATLLLPYFETDVDSGDGSGLRSTTFSVRNAGPAPTLAHVTLYTDYGVPTYAYDTYLTGYDVERISLLSIFAENSLHLAQDTPVTGTPVAGPTLTSLFSDGFESGDLSGWSTYASDVTIGTLRAYHSGQPAEREGNCAGSDYGDNLARGYVLVDATQVASTAFPGANSYFINGGNGIATNENVLTGDFELRDDANNYAVGETLIHIEAASVGETATAGEYTFYSRYTGPFATDNREPLATQWGVRNIGGGAFDQGTDLLYWRDVKIAQSAFPCGSPPLWAPLSAIEILAFDEEENVVNLGTNPGFPLACGRVTVGVGFLQSPFDFGWLRVNFSDVNQGNFSGIDQGAIVAIHSIAGRMSVGTSGMALDNALTYTP